MLAVIAFAWTCLYFTVPQAESAIRTYVVERGNALDGWTRANIYRTPNVADTTITPGRPGDRDSVWVIVTTQANSPYGWRRGGQAFRLNVRTAGNGVSAWSNFALYAAGCPDTIMVEERCGGYPVAGVFRSQRAPTDTILTAHGAPGPIATYETAMLAGWRDDVCAIFRSQMFSSGYYALKGVRIGCAP